MAVAVALGGTHHHPTPEHASSVCLQASTQAMGHRRQRNAPGPCERLFQSACEPEPRTATAGGWTSSRPTPPARLLCAAPHAAAVPGSAAAGLHGGAEALLRAEWLIVRRGSLTHRLDAWRQSSGGRSSARLRVQQPRDLLHTHTHAHTRQHAFGPHSLMLACRCQRDPRYTSNRCAPAMLRQSSNPAAGASQTGLVDTATLDDREWVDTRAWCHASCWAVPAPCLCCVRSLEGQGLGHTAACSARRPCAGTGCDAVGPRGSWDSESSRVYVTPNDDTPATLNKTSRMRWCQQCSTQGCQHVPGS